MKIQLKHENCVRFSSIVVGSTFVMIIAPSPSPSVPLPPSQFLIYLKTLISRFHYNCRLQQSQIKQNKQNRQWRRRREACELKNLLSPRREVGSVVWGGSVKRGLFTVVFTQSAVKKRKVWPHSSLDGKIKYD